MRATESRKRSWGNSRAYGLTGCLSLTHSFIPLLRRRWGQQQHSNSSKQSGNKSGRHFFFCLYSWFFLWKTSFFLISAFKLDFSLIFACHVTAQTAPTARRFNNLLDCSKKNNSCWWRLRVVNWKNKNMKKKEEKYINAKNGKKLAVILSEIFHLLFFVYYFLIFFFLFCCMR